MPHFRNFHGTSFDFDTSDDTFDFKLDETGSDSFDDLEMLAINGNSCAPADDQRNAEILDYGVDASADVPDSFFDIEFG